MNTEPIVFRQGEENGIVIERENFKSSIFVDQYQQAIDLFARLWERQKGFRQKTEDCKPKVYGIDNQFSNIIAFCGDRGEGKTSSMISFATLLTDNNVREKAKEALAYPLDNSGKEILPSSNEIEWLDVIDPSFFDEQHNLLELMLGQMYAKASEIHDQSNGNQGNEFAYKRRKLMEQFQIVKNSIHLLECDEKLYDSISEMSDLSASIQLKSDIQKLFKCYLDYISKKCLLICIDDIDLNIKDAYRMSEMLRKYFISPYCIVLVAVKTEQLVEVIAKHHEVAFKLSSESSLQIARKYVAKLFPRGNRIPMPAVEDICERKIRLADSYGKYKKDLDGLTVKERVVQLIFQKTGYVFYNGQYLSPIVPTNLRSLRHLLGALESLPDARGDNWEDNETGREIFKDYFFGTWATQLHEDDYPFALQLAEYTDLSTFNAFVVEYFAKRIKDAKIEFNRIETKEAKLQEAEVFDEKEAKDESDELNVVELQERLVHQYNDIVNRTNTSTNISYGDVMYILWLISSITVDENLQRLIFFIRTVYSMRLYTCYNEVTEGRDETLFPKLEPNETRINIHKADSLYENVNRIQRLVNGAYFTYPQGSLLSRRRDRLMINFDKVKVLFERLKKENKEKTDKEKEDSSFIQLLQTCEYLAMCIVAASTKENIEKDNFGRISKTPVFLGTFSHRAHFALFDFLNPFYALCNIKYAYNRFDEILFENPQQYSSIIPRPQGLLYSIANQNPKSLLSEMKGIRRGDYEWDMQGMLSDIVVRVSDIQVAIYDELLRQYRTHRVGTIAEKIYYAYKDIINLNMTLYPKLSVKDNRITIKHGPHPIKFEFLTKLCNFLSVSENASVLENTLYVSPEDKRTQELNMFLKNVTSALLRVLFWPMKGKDLRVLISEASKLKGAVKASFTKNLKHFFNDEEQYEHEQVTQKLGDIMAMYQLLNSK